MALSRSASVIPASIALLITRSSTTTLLILRESLRSNRILLSSPFILSCDNITLAASIVLLVTKLLLALRSIFSRSRRDSFSIAKMSRLSISFLLTSSCCSLSRLASACAISCALTPSLLPCSTAVASPSLLSLSFIMALARKVVESDCLSSSSKALAPERSPLLSRLCEPCPSNIAASKADMSRSSIALEREVTAAVRFSLISLNLFNFILASTKSLCSGQRNFSPSSTALRKFKYIDSFEVSVVGDASSTEVSSRFLRTVLSTTIALFSLRSMQILRAWSNFSISDPTTRKLANTSKKCMIATWSSFSTATFSLEKTLSVTFTSSFIPRITAIAARTFSSSTLSILAFSMASSKPVSSHPPQRREESRALCRAASALEI
mmetsp:Transcript_19470/g.18797  ORF Transcript_19470/g.18797 Transcript_19470/m.18797 type:complete len:381 (+) Transcript_19470:758-1900(+)